MAWTVQMTGRYKPNLNWESKEPHFAEFIEDEAKQI